MIWMLLFLAQAAADSGAVARGEKLFAASCAVGYCHGSGGAAARGPRLRDRKFDAGYLDKVTRDGIPRTAMPGWKERLKDDEIRAVVAYVLSLSGAPGAPAALAPSAPPAAAPAGRPGRGVFLDRCGSCHAAQGVGAAVAGDITGKTGLPVAAKRVKTVRLKDGESFPALIASEEAGIVRVYDLTEPPPVKRSLERAEIASLADAASWAHPKVDAGVLVQIVEFLK